MFSISYVNQHSRSGGVGVFFLFVVFGTEFSIA